MLNLFLYFGIAFVCVVIYEEFGKRKFIAAFKGNIPIAFGLPLFGIVYKFARIKHLLYVIDAYFYRFQEFTYCTWFGKVPIIITADLEDLKAIHTSEDYINKPTILYDAVSYALPNGLLTSQSIKWKTNRKLINPSFNIKIINAFLPNFNKGMKAAEQALSDLVNGKEHDIYDIIKSATLRMTMENIMGFKFEENTELYDELVRDFNFMMTQVLQDITKTPLGLGFLVRNAKYHTALKNLRNVGQKAITDQKPTLETGNSQKSANKIFIQHAYELLESGHFQMDDVITESFSIISASYETTSATIYSILLMLAMHSGVQEKLYQQICEQFPDANAQIEYDHLQQIPYLDMVINETLRLLPAVPLYGRETVRATRLRDNLILPARTTILISVFSLHRRKDLWGAYATQFNPDHFLPENIAKMNSFAFMPFSKGMRNCIGWRYASLSIRVMILGLVRNLKFSTNFKFADLVFVNRVSLDFETKPKLIIEKRF